MMEVDNGSQALRILVVSSTEFRLDGITSVILNYYRSMDSSNMQFGFVMPSGVEPYLRLQIEENGGTVHVVDGRTTHPMRYLKRLAAVIDSGHYDVVHAHGNSCTLALEMVAATRARARVRIAHSHNTTCKHQTLNHLLRPIFERTYTHAFACGHDAGAWLFGQRPFEIINNGIDAGRYRPDAVARGEYRRRLGYRGEILVGHVGNFTYQKNHAFLVSVFDQLHRIDRRYRLVLVGDGALRQEVQGDVKRRGLDKAVTFVGRSREVPGLLQAMDLMVMPSRFEGLPLALVEAQAANLPCFVSDAITQEVAVGDGIEFLSLQLSSSTWASRIHERINEVGFSRKLNSDQEKLAQFDIEGNAVRLKTLYERYATSTGGRVAERQFRGHGQT